MQSDTFTQLIARIANIRADCAAGHQHLGDTKKIIDDDDEQKWMIHCRQHQPLLSTMLKIDQRMLERLIEYLQDWLQALIQNGDCQLDKADRKTDDDDQDYTANNIEWIGKWLYAALACLHQPLEPTMHHLLREIVRTCKQHRDALPSTCNVERAAPLNLLICIICSNYRQYDLADI